MLRSIPLIAFLAGTALASPLSASAQTAASPWDPEAITALMKKVNAYQLAHPWRETDRNWIRATYYTGVMGAYHATGDTAYLDQARAWGEKHQ